MDDMTSAKDFSNVIHCTYLREEGENVFLIGDDDTEYQVQKTSVNLRNFPCTIQGKDDGGEPVLFIVSADNDPLNEDMTCQETTARWNDVNTRLLLAWYPELKKKVMNNILPTKRRMWEEMSRRFLEQGVELSAQQVENRWKTLDRRYRTAYQYSSKRSNAFTYFREFEGILQQFAHAKKRKPRILPSKKMEVQEHVETEMASDASNSDQLISTVNNAISKRTQPDTSLAFPAEKKMKVQSVSRELALLRQAFVQRQARKDELEAMKEQNRNKRHQAEMTVLNSILQSLSKQKTLVSNLSSINGK